MASFEIGGIVVALEAGDGTVQQTYQPKREGNILEMGDGTSIKQSLIGTLGKLRTVLSVQTAWSPAAIANLDFSAEMPLKCAEQRSAADAVNVITITSKRRSDSPYDVKGYGIVDGRLVSSPVAINVDEVTVTPVPGATSYEVVYWPEINVFASFREGINSGAGSTLFSWSLTCVEV